MEASTCRNMALILSRYSYSHWRNVFSAFSFPEFESAQRTKFLSSKFKFVDLFLTVHNYFTYF